MKRLLLLVFSVGLLMLTVSVPAFAGGIALSGTINSNPLPNGDNDDNSNTCTVLTFSGTYNYTLRRIQVTVSGDYTYRDNGELDTDPSTMNAWIAFYTGSRGGFNPADPREDGCFANFNTSGTVNLSANVPYLIKVSSEASGPPDNVGNYSVSISGPGDVIDLDATAGNPMLADGRINGQQAAPVILYCNGTTTHGLTVDGQVAFNVENGKSASGSWGSIAPMADGRMLLTSATPDSKPYYFVYAGCPHGHYDAMSGDPAMVSDSGDY